MSEPSESVSQRASSRTWILVAAAVISLYLGRTVWDLVRERPVTEATFLDVLEELTVSGRPLPRILEEREIDEDTWYRAMRHYSGHPGVRRSLEERLRSHHAPPSPGKVSGG